MLLFVSLRLHCLDPMQVQRLGNNIPVVPHVLVFMSLFLLYYLQIFDRLIPHQTTIQLLLYQVTFIALLYLDT